MGSSASSQPAVGVAINPRVEYASKIAQSEGKTHLIDAPVLVDLSHGTIRYRYVDKQQQQQQPETVDSSQSSEVAVGPHVGSKDLEYKRGYFFHAKFADYSNGASQANTENDYKFKYVFKGPKCAKNKRLYYVTGQKMHAPDHTPSYASGLNSPIWPNVERESKHIYLSLEFLVNDNASTNGSIDELVEQLNTYAPVILNINNTDSIESLIEKVSMQILKPTSHIHIFYQFYEIRAGTNVYSLNDTVTAHQGVKVKLSKLSN